MKILYKIASRSRPDKFFKTLDNVTSLMERDNYTVLASLDVDDIEMRPNKIVDRLNTYKNIQVHWGISNTKIEAINRDIGLCNEWDILVNLSDDQEFTVKGFDTRIVSDMQKYFPDTDGMLWYNDDTFNGEKMCTMSIIGRKYFERTGYIYLPEYKSVYCDEHETRKAKALNKIQYSSDVLYLHKHWIIGTAEQDELNRRNDSDEMYEHDRKVFYKYNPTLFIKFATRGRRENFFHALRNIYNTITTEYFKISVSCDLNDPEMNNPDVKKFCRAYPNLTLHFSEQTSKVGAINANINHHCEFSWLLNMSDDFTFLENGWDVKMQEDIKSVWGDSLDYLAHFSDGFTHEKLPTMAIMGRDFYKRFNYIYHPSYKSVSCDAEQFWVSQMLGRHHYFNKIYFKHIHPSNLGFPADATYRGNDIHGYNDTKNYFHRMKNKFFVHNPVLIPEALQLEINSLK